MLEDSVIFSSKNTVINLLFESLLSAAINPEILNKIGATAPEFKLVVVAMSLALLTSENLN